MVDLFYTLTYKHVLNILVAYNYLLLFYVANGN